MITTPLGSIDCTVEDEVITSLTLTKSSTKDSIQNPIYTSLSKELSNYFSGKSTTFSIPMKIMVGTPLQKKVWETLLQIPYGSVVTYSDLAQMAGYPRAIRAVATAVGKNPIPIIIPCHRVVGKSDLWKFGWGRAWKEFLLKCEGVEFH